MSERYLSTGRTRTSCRKGSDHSMKEQDLSVNSETQWKEHVEERLHFSTNITACDVAGDDGEMKSQSQSGRWVLAMICAED